MIDHVSDEHFTRHLILILADTRRVWEYHRRWRAGEITKDELLHLLADAERNPLRCNECEAIGIVA